jgi:hypothetical protein
MANYKGDVATAVNTGGLSNAVVQGNIDARKKVNLESYTILGTEASGSTINIGGNLPKNAKVLSITLSVTAAQTSATFSIGDSDSATRYASASTSLQTAGRYGYDGKQYVVGTATGDNAVLLTTGGATLTAGTLRAEIEYVLD